MTYAVAEAELGAVQSKATKLLSSLGAKTILFPALQPRTSRVGRRSARRPEFQQSRFNQPGDRVLALLARTVARLGQGIRWVGVVLHKPRPHCPPRFAFIASLTGPHFNAGPSISLWLQLVS